ncbi:MAG: hypothetical protein U9R14_04015 [Patescibacteria group bacterium]|nr:hypothetical protein [Patescibacteria group bacterium]
MLKSNYLIINFKIMVTTQEIRERINKNLKCPFGPCDKCEKNMDKEHCVIAESANLIKSFYAAFFGLNN